MFPDKLNRYTITLASQSPRRRELLAGLGLDFTVEPSKDESEAYSDDLPPEEVPAFLARHKSETFHRPLREREILLTADTIVLLDGRVLGKPEDREDAVRMLEDLSGRTHSVITGVCLRTNERTLCFSDTTKVTFREMTHDEIEHYVDHYRPLDKAGAYGCQEWIGHTAITRLDGSFYNVMGLPTHRIYSALTEITGTKSKLE